MSVAWGRRSTDRDDSIFVHEAMKEAAEASGLNPETVKFSDFPTHTQSTILRKAALMKSEYHVMTERLQ